MADPFSNMSAAGDDFIAVAVEALERRAAEPVMSAAVDRYLEALPKAQIKRVVEIGAGSGPVSRRIAAWAPAADVLATEPAAGFLPHARALAEGIGNLRFETRDGTALGLEDASVDLVVLHTVLSHVPDPAPLLDEAFRVLRNGGWLVIFDGDFSKGSLASFPGDPLAACQVYFQQNFVVDPFICGQLAEIARGAGFETRDFWMSPRVIRDDDGMIIWVQFTTNMMRDRGQIGPELAQGLMDEYARRRDAGTLLGFQAYATLIAQKHAEG
ncbi:class I SAM-dependent methyltransferase [Alloyangia pacifica]|uniref:Methyltransferase domain-containing protein n=1 Tax=Alloyangia pacifica TaxID=311180 RepID=A0A1I6QWL0_9RHOB|nr:class I SAM-dependent methyltransferase [Alloyangia pacifica]SDG02165.1 Methyltransferase domain-containing protein [Alloyangia pacifica]SFS56773.1 Methyltransferase domain-containing protein [Alloyangia pacifica]